MNGQRRLEQTVAEGGRGRRGRRVEGEEVTERGRDLLCFLSRGRKGRERGREGGGRGREESREERGEREREERRKKEGRERERRKEGRGRKRREGKRGEREERICLLKVKGRSLKNS